MKFFVFSLQRGDADEGYLEAPLCRENQKAGPHDAGSDVEFSSLKTKDSPHESFFAVKWGETLVVPLFVAG